MTEAAYIYCGAYPLELSVCESRETLSKFFLSAKLRKILDSSTFCRPCALSLFLQEFCCEGCIGTSKGNFAAPSMYVQIFLICKFFILSKLDVLFFLRALQMSSQEQMASQESSKADEDKSHSGEARSDEESLSNVSAWLEDLVRDDQGRTLTFGKSLMTEFKRNIFGCQPC